MAEVDGVLDRPVHDVLGEVVALLNRPRRVDLVAVVDQGGGVLVGLAVEEPVEAFEAASERPPLAGGTEVGLVLGGQVPLAHRVGRVPAGGEHLGQEADGSGDGCVVAGEPRGQLDDAAHPRVVVVAAGEHAGPGGRAQRGGVEVAVAEPVGGEAVDVGGGDVGAEAAELGEAHVVEQDHDHVRSPRGRPDRLGPVRGGVPVVGGDGPGELVGLHGSSRRVGPTVAVALGGAPVRLSQPARDGRRGRFSPGRGHRRAIPLLATPCRQGQACARKGGGAALR